MRPPFTDIQRIKRQAKRTVDQGHLDVRRWWSSKYSRPHNDPLFGTRPIHAWISEMYEDAYERVRDLETLLDDPDIRQEERRNLSQRLRKLYKMLGETDEDKAIGEDPLIDQWEKDLDEGRMPDLDAPVPARKKM